MTQPTMGEVAEWLRELSEEKYREWAEFRGHDRFAKAEMWANRAAQVEAMGQQSAAESLMLEEFAGLLERMKITSCHCMTKTPVHTFHDKNCRYRVVCEALEKYQQLKVQP